MKNLTDILIDAGNLFDVGLQEGADLSNRFPLGPSKDAYASIRVLHGLSEGGRTIMLTEPRGNHKLGLASIPTYGLTLQHYVQRFKSRNLVVNACPNAGDCTKVCVLDNGYGSMPGIAEARRARTEFLARFPFDAGVLIGRELALAVRRHGMILFRPNVNSDVEWERIAPSLTSGSLFGADVLSYGYTKLTNVLLTDGWLDDRYRVAYSWNENSEPDEVYEFLRLGGSVAVVTSRRKGAPVIRRGLPAGGFFEVVDADLTDEWIFQRGVIGDLSAKGKARRLIGRSGFIVQTGAA